MKVDVFKRQERFLKWKERVLVEGIPELNRANSDVVIQYVLDMEVGRNIASSSAKGGRSYPRLCNILQKMSWIARQLQQRGVSDLRVCDEQVAAALFSDMERGILLTQQGKPYRSYGDYAKVFKSFWHWWMKVNRKQGQAVLDITEDLRTDSAKPSFVYLSRERLEQMLPYFSEEEQVILYFLFDSLVRPPTEVLSLRAGNVSERDGEIWITIPDEISKTFGRSLNLLYSGKALRNYIRKRDLGPNDLLFEFKPWLLNRKLQEVAAQLFGDEQSHAGGELIRNVTLYDLRHSGAVHFRLLAKENPGLVSLDAVRHRGGWADLTMLNYYTAFLGLDGEIRRQGMLLPREKHHLEQELDALRREMAEIKALNAQIMQLAKSSTRTLAAPPLLARPEQMNLYKR